MRTDLITHAQLAAMFDVDEKKLTKWRLRYGWPAVKIGRTVLFTPEQVEQILADHSKRPAAGASPAITGQTSRSASRSRAS